MKVYLIRHGETDMNIEHRLQGRTDWPLNENGRRQARGARKELQQRGVTCDRIYCSPLDRALETCELVSGVSRDDFIIDDRIIEMNMGAYETLVYEDLGEAFMHSYFKDPEHYQPPEGGEDYHTLIARVGDFLDELAEKRPGESVLVVSHGGAIHAMLAYIEGIDLADFWKQRVGNCSIFELSLTGGSFTVTAKDDRKDTFAE
ncbi:MAG: histidine phosphatase family protein [Anaerovoracaceae bacterium]|jgi:broad specificity phosphatase PhoE